MFVYCKEWMRSGHIYVEMLRKKKKKSVTAHDPELRSIQYNIRWIDHLENKKKKTSVSWSKRSLVLQQEENGILMCPTKWTVNKGNLLALLSANLQPKKKQRSLHLPMSVCCQWTIYHDCQNKFGSLLYNERSWISRFATCQSISRAWMHLQSTSPVGNSHHQLSSLWHHEYLS